MAVNIKERKRYNDTDPIIFDIMSEEFGDYAKFTDAWKTMVPGTKVTITEVSKEPIKHQVTCETQDDRTKFIDAIMRIK